MGKLFGTDGVRGIANGELTSELAYSLGVAGGYVLSRQSEKRRPRVIIGKDTRISGDLLECSLSAGILAMGCDVIRAGVLPTPAIAFLVRDMNADAGVVISASHNPYEYNGIKFFKGDGYKLDDSTEDEIERIVLENINVNGHITGDLVGRSYDASEEAFHRYTSFLTGSVKGDFKGMKVVIDCANGAAFHAAEAVFRSLGADVTLLGVAPDGININDGCGSTHPELMASAVVRAGADLGLAFDGDADRLIAADEKGDIIDGDKIMYICARELKKRDGLTGNILTATVMSNIGLELALKDAGIDMQASDVGDRYVLEMMLETGCILGGEQSGHIIFLKENTTGDGIYAALRLTEAVRDRGGQASHIAGEIRIYPQVLRNAKVKNELKNSYGDDPEIAAEIKSIEDDLKGQGRALIRPSGTEPLVRVMLEGSDADMLAKRADALAELIEKKLS